MKVFLIEKPGNTRFEEIPLRPLKPDEVLVRVKHAGICGTDLSFYTGENDFVRRGLVKYPVRIGHEWSGVVERVEADVKNFKPGDRVIGDNGVTCGICPGCLSGDMGKCENGKSVGTINCWDGAFAEYIIMPERHLYPVPENVNLEAACLNEPATIPYAALSDRAGKLRTVAIIGTGPIGMAGIPLAKHLGAERVIMVGRNARKLEVAKKLNADAIINLSEENAEARVLELTGGKRAELVLEASGAPESIGLAMKLVAYRGHISLLAFYEREISGLKMDEFVFKTATMGGIMGRYGLAREVTDLIGRGLDLLPLVTQRINFNELEEVFPKAISMPDRVKILVEF